MKNLAKYSILFQISVFITLVLSLHSSAYAGYWTCDRYVWDGTSTSASVFYHEIPVAGMHGYQIKKGTYTERNSVPPDGQGSHGHPTSTSVGWQDRSPMEGVEEKRAASSPEASSYVKSSVYAVLKWNRNRKYNALDFSYIDDPDDNPTEYIYASETFGIYAGKSVFAYAGTMPAYDGATQWPGDYIKVTGHIGNGKVNCTFNPSNWVYGRGYDAIGATYGYSASTSGSSVKKLKVSGDTLNVPTVNMEGNVDLSTGYEIVGGQGSGGISFGYNVEPLNLAFSLSTSPSGDSTGFIAGTLYWDGTSYTTDSQNVDINTGQPLQIPVTRRVAPEEKNYYVVISGTITLPNAIPAPASVNVTAERVRSNGKGGFDSVGESADIPLVLVSKSRSGFPVPNGSGSSGSTTYTYRTHDLDDDEDLPRRIGGSQDWHINDKKGRWQFKVKDWYSNKVQFKIDKRGQVAGYALDWAGYYAYKRDNAADQEERDKWSTTVGPGGSWRNCFTFAGAVYGRMGLTIAGNDGSGMFGAATAPDEGRGSLRFFWSNMNPPTGAGDPGHVGIVGPNTYWTGAGTRIDNNGAPADSTGFSGPTWRGIDEGVGSPGYFGPDHPTHFPQSKTLPGERNGAISLLQELDEE